MTKPPRSTPHSDIDGVHEDERPNTDTANEAGQDNEDLKRAAEESVARPRGSGERGGKGGRA